MPPVERIKNRFRNTGVSPLNDDGFLVFAEHAAQGVGDFTDRGVGLNSVEDCREKVLRTGGAALELRECGLNSP